MVGTGDSTITYLDELILKRTLFLITVLSILDNPTCLKEKALRLIKDKRATGEFGMNQTIDRLPRSPLVQRVTDLFAVGTHVVVWTILRPSLFLFLLITLYRKRRGQNTDTVLVQTLGVSGIVVVDKESLNTLSVRLNDTNRRDVVAVPVLYSDPTDPRKFLGGDDTHRSGYVPSWC